MWNLLLGPLVGLGGSALTKWLDQRAEASKQAHELAMRRADAELMAQEWAQRAKVAEIETTGASDVAASQAFSVALQAESQRYSQGMEASRGQKWLMFILDFTRGMVRPALTLYLCAITSAVAVQAYLLLDRVPMDQFEAWGMLKTIVEKVLFLTETVVLFWFGTRSKGSK